MAAARGGGGLLGDAPRRPAVGRAAADGERSRPALRLRDAYRRLRPARAARCDRAGGRRRRPHLPVARRPERRAQQGRLRRARGAGSAVAAHGQPAAGEGAAPVDRPARRNGRRDRGRRRQGAPAAVGARRPSVRGFGAGRARRAGAGRPPDRAPHLAARAHARPRPRRGDRPGVHHGRDAGVADPGRRDGRARALPPLALPHEIRRRLRRACPAAEAPAGGESRRCRCHLRPAAGGDDPGPRRACLQVDTAARTVAAGGTGRPRGAHRRARRRRPSGRRAPRPRRAVAACASSSGSGLAGRAPARLPSPGGRRARQRCGDRKPGAARARGRAAWPAPTRRSPIACAGWRWDC